jgi:hypothetical protein
VKRVHHVTHKIKKKILVPWKHPLSAPAKKIKAVPSARKIMGAGFWVHKGVPVVTLTAERYCGSLETSRQAIDCKRTWSLCQDITMKMQAQMGGYGPSSVRPCLDLAPTYVHLFGPVKKPLSGKQLGTDADMK